MSIFLTKFRRKLKYAKYCSIISTKYKAKFKVLSIVNTKHCKNKQWDSFGIYVVLRYHHRPDARKIAFMDRGLSPSQIVKTKRKNLQCAVPDIWIIIYIGYIIPDIYRLHDGWFLCSERFPYPQRSSLSL